LSQWRNSKTRWCVLNEKKKIPCVVALNLVDRKIFTLLFYIGFCYAANQLIVTRSGKNKHFCEVGLFHEVGAFWIMNIHVFHFGSIVQRRIFIVTFFFCNVRALKRQKKLIRWLHTIALNYYKFNVYVTGSLFFYVCSLQYHIFIVHMETALGETEIKFESVKKMWYSVLVSWLQVCCDATSWYKERDFKFVFQNQNLCQKCHV
jgi:hypothetical protein